MSKMSNVDRYRPPREGYQPPTLPPKPPPPVAMERLSKSPIRRRDFPPAVPPAVPSPPALSSRTSPPRPLSRRSAPSPAHLSPRPPPARRDQWYFTTDELASTPSIIDGISLAEERLRRFKGTNFICQAGIILKLPTITLFSASVFFHRFYMRHSMVEDKGGIHPYNIAATALFLANKTEENCRSTENLIVAVTKVAQKNNKLIIDKSNKEYWRWRDAILAYEEVMLEALTFDFMVENPYDCLYQHLDQLGLLNNKALRHSAWAFCNDSVMTVLPLMMRGRAIAIAGLFYASSIHREPIDDVQGEPWWRSLGANEELTIKAVQVMNEFYLENPGRKQSPQAPASPEFNLESTRRRGDVAGLSQLAIGDDSQNGTPTPTDRGATQSPLHLPPPVVARDGAAAKTNGKRVKEEDSNSMAVDKTLEMATSRGRGDSDVALKAAANDLAVHEEKWNGGSGLVSPGIGKRKSVDMDGNEEDDRSRDRKKVRVIKEEDDDEDEGEIKGA